MFCPLWVICRSVKLCTTFLKILDYKEAKDVLFHDVSKVLKIISKVPN
jgi:hypothetical protein